MYYIFDLSAFTESSSPFLIRNLQSMQKCNPGMASLAQCSEDTNKQGQ